MEISWVFDNFKLFRTYAFFDHIPSNSPFILPINDLCHYCKQLNITCIIDGAHALGSIDLRFDYEDDYLPDIYLTNCHKWFCAPKGVGLLYIKSNSKLRIRPCVQSHGINSGMHSEFLWTGLKDYASFLALTECLRFWSYYGMKTIMDRNTQLAKEASDLLVKMWNTSKLTSDDISGPMRCIKLPIYNDNKGSFIKTFGMTTSSATEDIFENDFPLGSVENKHRKTQNVTRKCKRNGIPSTNTIIA
ncbi:unnamed protein product [Didymodactylos carnosus]|uniref:Aminotransferase class V domain-containing protein n=1 Tax=Didymodactylos carnosus TaxID=1234261 RepID=A0A814UZ71_9BILA|nr:unnamed protein product [Didymodactylos carnosus]CAF1180429.1 unnamed protein product [Didymodactylos carnosus]CAF3944720.1 unnamed protein product [Didymodactylos carnosus]CAF3969114.1 unnamed protein product [Didymodactylos carnosus]